VARRLLSPARDRMLVTAFHSPATVAPRGVSIPGSTLPGLLLRVQSQSAPPPVRLPALPRTSVCPEVRRRQCRKPVAVSPTGPAGCTTCLHSPWGSFDPSGSKRSAGSAACQSAFRTRPISLRSPQPLSIARFRPRINVPGPLRFRRLAVPQASWNLSQYAPEGLFRQRDCDFGNLISSGFIWFAGNALRPGRSGFSVHKTRGPRFVQGARARIMPLSVASHMWVSSAPASTTARATAR
jgi:hypothetical protein